MSFSCSIYFAQQAQVHKLIIPLDNNDDEKNKNNPIEVIGILDEADNSKKKIRLTKDNGDFLNVKVPDGLGDIVKKYWGEKVLITGIKKGKTIELEDINYP